VHRVGNIFERIEGLLSEASGKLIDGDLGCAGIADIGDRLAIEVLELQAFVSG
jgi:hypothetical protein